jgi:predicted N-acetyltransferase YhbS
VDIRPIQPADAAAAAVLCAQFGYPTDTPALLARMTQITGDRHRAVPVACLDDEVAGWIDLSVKYHLQSEPAALIGGLVASERARGQGIGRQLCTPGRWALHGCGCDRTQSGSARTLSTCGMGMCG